MSGASTIQFLALEMACRALDSSDSIVVHCLEFLCLLSAFLVLIVFHIPILIHRWYLPANCSTSTIIHIPKFQTSYYNRLSFGITSAPNHFHRRISENLTGVTGTVSMIDDVLILGINKEEHDKHLAVALGKIQRAGLTLNKEKCQFSKDRITFLGQIIDGSGVHPDPDKVSAIKEIGILENVSNICHFLGMYNQLSKFVPNLENETKPLRDLLCKDCLWTWERLQQDALEKLKRLLSSTSVSPGVV